MFPGRRGDGPEPGDWWNASGRAAQYGLLLIWRGGLCEHLKDLNYHLNEWLLNGIGKTEDVKGVKNSFIENDATKFHLQKGNLIFQKKNFKINGDLFLYAQNYIGIQNLEYIPFSYYQEENINEPKNDLQRKILKNLPFARRGYVFQNQELNTFYKKMDWYISNPNYEPNTEILTENEKKWTEKWK